MASTVSDIISGLESEIAAELPTWKELPYRIDIEKNSFKTQTDRWGVRALGQTEVDGVTKYLTFIGSFEVTLTQGPYKANLDDSEQIDLGLGLRATMLDLFKRFINTKGGSPGSVMNITDLSQGEVEYLSEDKVAVLRSTMNITYRLSL